MRGSKPTALIARFMTSAVASATLTGLASPSEARAEEPKFDAADGPAASQEFEERNARELSEWQKAQPPVPYQYPHSDDVLGAPWGGFLKGLGSTADLILATVIPHFGAQVRAETPAALVSWPLSVPFGAPYTVTRKQGSFTVMEHQAHRAMLEPGFVASDRGVGLFVRPGYRFIYHPSDWVVGVGGGLGSTVEVSGNREPFRPSVSPEAVLHFGRCCERGYFTLAGRYDHFFAGDVRNILGASLGYVYF